MAKKKTAKPSLTAKPPADRTKAAAEFAEAKTKTETAKPKKPKVQKYKLTTNIHPDNHARLRKAAYDQNAGIGEILDQLIEKHLPKAK